jgi:hypothetical protein
MCDLNVPQSYGPSRPVTSIALRFLHLRVLELNSYCILGFSSYRYTHNASVRFEVFTAVTMENDVFWAVTPCGVRRLLVTASFVPSSPILVILMKEALSSS